MFLVLEYLSLMVLVVILAALLFAACAMVLVAREAVRRLAETSRKLADHAIDHASSRVYASIARLSRDHQYIH